MRTIQLSPEWSGTSYRFQKTWAHVGNIDQFRWLSRGDVQEHLRMARDELGLRYVRAAAMYSPEMRVFGNRLADWKIPEADRTKHLNWQMVDLSIEALLNLGLKPIYTTCFTPLGMTDNPATCWPDKNPSGMPRDLAQWQDFVASGIRHHIERYGIDEVRSWYFECWNEPNLDWFFNGTQEEFFRLWSATWHAIKSVDASLRFGGPSTARGEWIPDFLRFTEKDGTRPDYLITHVYNNDSGEAPFSPFDGPAADRAADSPHFAAGVIRGARKAARELGWTGEFHWNEWGRSWFPQDPAKETALEPAFIVKTMAECSHEADAFAFWCLSDIYDQIGFQSSEFQGHYGMLSLHGLRKQAWLAHQMLGRLGEDRVNVRNGNSLVNVIATRNNGLASALVYAYPDKPGSPSESIRVELDWPFRKPALIRLGAEENNIIAKWKELGAPDYPTPCQVSQLREANSFTVAPANAVTIKSEPTGTKAVFEMECPGVALLEEQA